LDEAETLVGLPVSFHFVGNSSHGSAIEELQNEELPCPAEQFLSPAYLEVW
jgi:hypothetical protein